MIGYERQVSSFVVDSLLIAGISLLFAGVLATAGAVILLVFFGVGGLLQLLLLPLALISVLLLLVVSLVDIKSFYRNVGAAPVIPLQIPRTS